MSLLEPSGQGLRKNSVATAHVQHSLPCKHSEPQEFAGDHPNGLVAATRARSSTKQGLFMLRHCQSSTRYSANSTLGALPAARQGRNANPPIPPERQASSPAVKPGVSPGGKALGSPAVPV